jgi:hypothetical protein
MVKSTVSLVEEIFVELYFVDGSKGIGAPFVWFAQSLLFHL